MSYRTRDKRSRILGVLLYTDVCQIWDVDYINRRAIIGGEMLQKEGKYAVATPAYFVPNILLFCFLSNVLTITRLLFTLKCITKYDMFNTRKITGVEKREEDFVQSKRIFGY